MIRIISIVMACLWLQGCFPAAIAYTAYKWADTKTENAEKEQRSKDFQVYTNYRLEMERINLDRQKAGLRPNPILTQEEWIGAQTAGRPAVAPVKEDK